MKNNKWPQFRNAITLETCPGATINLCVEEAMVLLHSQTQFEVVKFQFNDRLIEIKKNDCTMEQALEQYYGGRDEI